MRKYFKYAITGVLVAVIALSTAYILVNQDTESKPDQPSLSAVNDEVTNPASQVPSALVATPPDPAYPHQYVGFFQVDSYLLLYNNSTSPYVADLELISGNNSNIKAVALVRFARDTTLPQDTYSRVSGVYTFTAYRQFDDLESILSWLQNTDCTIGFGRPAAGVAYGQADFSIIVSPPGNTSRFF